MNKIVTINIGGIAITIEENAFDALSDYLKNIGNHFKNTENGDEIIADIELRVGEMLQSKLSEAKISINVADVEDVAQTMGYPADFEIDEEEPSTYSKAGDNGTNEASDKNQSKKKRRLFRDIENQKVGGVCGGLAKYFEIDPTMLRIVLLVSLLVFGFGFWLYIILWAVLPGAKTAADKLEMMGEAPNVENIKNTIQNEAKATYDRIATPENRKSLSNLFESIINFLKTVFGVFFKLFAIAAFVGIIVLLITSLIGIVFNGHLFDGNSNMRFNGHVIDALVIGTGSWLFKIAFYLIFALPLTYLGMHILPELLSIPKPTKPVKQAMISGWFIAIILAIVGFFYSARQYQSEGITTEITSLELDSDTLVIRIDDVLEKEFKATKYTVKLDVIQSTNDQVEIKVQKSARGRNEEAAKLSTANIATLYKVSKHTLLLSEKVYCSNKANVANPEVIITVKVPIGQTVIFHESTKRVIHDIKNLQNIYDPEMAGHTFYMSEAGFKCMDCKGYSSKSTYRGDEEEFDKLEISGALKVEIIEGEHHEIRIPKYDDGQEWVEVEVIKNTLYLKQKHGFTNSEKTIVIAMPAVKAIKLEGASEVTLNGAEMDKTYFGMELEGASKAEIKGINCNKIAVEMNGASYAKFSGKTSLLFLESEGAAHFNGSDLKAENMNLDMTGASKASIWALEEISGDIKGASKLSYEGNPSLKVEKAVGASIKQLD